jgi:hypothetical protein
MTPEREESVRVHVPVLTTQPTPAGPVLSLYAVVTALLKLSIAISAEQTPALIVRRGSHSVSAVSTSQRFARVTLV